MKTGTIIMLCFTAIILNACGKDYMAGSDMERLAATSFEPSSSREFRFTALTYYDTTSPEERQSEQSEQEKVRIKWLEKYLLLNGMCGNGYEITDRNVSVTDDRLFKQQQIFYYGKCD